MLRRTAFLSSSALALGGVILLGGCTSSPDGGDRDRAEVRTATPSQAVTVLDQESPTARARAASATFFDRTPLVVVAPADDPAAQQEAATHAST